MQNFVEYLTVMATNDSFAINLTKYNFEYHHIMYHL